MVLNTLLNDLPGVFREGTALGFASFAGYFGPMFFYSALVVGAHEVVHNFFELRRMDKEREELKKAHLQSQLDSLKSQVNPHFLFNSLNTLLSLISTSPERAERFVEELSSVYRYLLQTNQHELATLRQELDFAHSYFHLLKTRFGAGIELTLRIDDDLLEHRLPSLTLQLLLENAVKHNVIAAATPLAISIRTEYGGHAEAGRLVVRNNLQRKVQQVPSSRMGLNNIITKLKLLNQTEAVITEDEDFFTVTLPLLKTK
jgi:LytS/YehU family sensor histidine kinase